MGKNEEKPKRTRRPLNKYTAAQAIDRILAKIPPDERAKVLDFVSVPRQTEIPLSPGNA